MENGFLYALRGERESREEEKMRRKSSKALIIVLLVLVLLLGALCAGMLCFLKNNFFVDGMVYPRNAEFLNLRNSDISLEEYEVIRAELPDCEIYWNVPFQNTTYVEDTTEITVNKLSAEDVVRLDYLTELKTVHAEGCLDYEQLLALQQRRPELAIHYTVTVDGQDYAEDASGLTITDITGEEIALLEYLPEVTSVNADACQDYDMLLALQQAHPDYQISYTVPIAGEEYDESTTELAFTDPDVAELTAMLQYLPRLQSVHITNPTCEAEAIIALADAYPAVDISWERKAFGQTVTSKDTEVDISGTALESLDQVADAFVYFPNLEKVIMCDCGFDNETMAAFREKMRPEYKVVWSVVVTGVTVRTDETIFHSSAHGVAMIDEQTYDLYYCEDMIVVDVGHSMIKYIPWVEGMPNLKYLILADNWLKDISPISSCKNLVYLELFINTHLDDLTPLLGCTALEDLSVASTFADVDGLEQMTWLKNLWLNGTPVTSAEKNLLTESLPDTYISFDGSTTGGGWRELQNYFDMRDLMGLPYNKW